MVYEYSSFSTMTDYRRLREGEGRGGGRVHNGVVCPCLQAIYIHTCIYIIGIWWPFPASEQMNIVNFPLLPNEVCDGFPVSAVCVASLS